MTPFQPARSLERYENRNASHERVLNIPNTITMAGYVAGLAWVAGAPSWTAIVSIIADDLDGYAAKKLGQESKLGENLDWAVDISLAALSLLRVGAPWWTIPLATSFQVYSHERTLYTPILGLRSGVMIYGILKDYFGQ